MWCTACVPPPILKVGVHMKWLGMVLALGVSGFACADDAVVLYAQGCHTYWEGGEPKYDCAPKQEVRLEFTGASVARWSGDVRLGDTHFTVQLAVERFTLPDGSVIASLLGAIRGEDGHALASASTPLTSDSSLSLASMVPYGPRSSAPQFFFGTPLAFARVANEFRLRLSGKP